LGGVTTNGGGIYKESGTLNNWKRENVVEEKKSWLRGHIAWGKGQQAARNRQYEEEES
jgi:hypothetical protein